MQNMVKSMLEDCKVPADAVHNFNLFNYTILIAFPIDVQNIFVQIMRCAIYFLSLNSFHFHHATYSGFLIKKILKFIFI